MRFLSIIGFNLALYGLTASNLAASAAPQSVPAVAPHPSDRLTLQQEGSPNDRGTTVIQGNGVEFAVPDGFKGGTPSSADTKAIVTASAKLYPSMASFVKTLEADPTILRAIAIDTSKQANSEIVLISRLPFPASMSLQELDETMAQALPSILPQDFKLSRHKIENVGSRQIVHLTINANIQGSKFQESIGLFREGAEVFQVTYVYGSQNARQAMPIFQQVISTFKVIRGGSNTTQPI